MEEPPLDLWSNAVLVVAGDFALVGLPPSRAIDVAAAAVGATPAQRDAATVIELRLRHVLTRYLNGVWRRAGQCPQCGACPCPEWCPAPSWASEWAVDVADLLSEWASWEYPDPPPSREPF